MKTNTLTHLFTAALLGLATLSAQAQDSFGTGGNTFTIDFVDVGNAGNANDAGAGGGSHSSLYGGVAYNYRISTFAISQNDITNATASGLNNVTAGAHAGNRPAASISWYEAAAYVNWMNTSNGHQAAYDLTYDSGWSMAMWGEIDRAATGVRSGTNAYRHKDAYYFLPSEDEWYKAAYHQNDGVNANYWDYATGSNAIPTAVSSGTDNETAVYGQPFATGPADVDNTGGLSPYGTMGQNGNTFELLESNFNGLNDDPSATRAIRGGPYVSPESLMRSSWRGQQTVLGEAYTIGFRVAAIPEPSTIIMLALTGLAMGITPLYRRLRRRRRIS